jgi:iron complex outermembrane recepter protein
MMSDVRPSGLPLHEQAKRKNQINKTNLNAVTKLSSTVLLGGGLLLVAVQVQAQTTEREAAASQTSGTAPNADEATDLGKVVVRARNRLEPLKDVPLSISVVSGKELQRLNATDIKDVLQRAGNVQWNQGNQRTSSLAIRGIGKIGQTEAQDPSVGVNVDGVNYAYNALTSSYDFVDIDSVEVTRGPQGTLLGKASSIGVISINTRRPSFTSEADYSVTFGQRDYLKGWAAGGGAVIDDLLAWRGTISFTKGDGYLTNIYNRDETTTNKNRFTGRVQFLLTPTENTNVRLILEKTPRAGETTNGLTIRLPTPATYANGAVNATTNETRLSRPWFTQQSSFTVNGTYLYGGPDGKSVDYATQRPIITGSNGVTLQVDQHFDVGDLASISAYKDYHFNAVNDTGVPFDVSRNSGGFNNDYKQWSQELRFSSKVGELVDYQAGLYFLRVLNNAMYQRVFGNDGGAWFASNTQYTTLSANASGLYLLRNSLAGLSLAFNSPTGLQQIKNDSKAAFIQANWHVTDPLTITTGVRLTREERNNTGSSFIRDNGSGAELNSAANGGFNSSNSGTVFNTGTGLIGDPLATVANAGYLNTTDPTQVALANATAQKYFGVATYAQLTGAQAAQIAAAKSIRAGQIGTLFAPTKAESFEKTLPAWVFSPTYKFNDKLSAFVTWQHSEKAGIAQFYLANSNLVREEKTDDFEIGFKTVLLNKTLTFNTTLYVMNIKDYQQSLSVLDPVQSAAGAPVYITTTGNVPKVQAKGVEIDSYYAGIPNTTLRLSAAYNDARYKDFKNAPQPVENGNLTGNAAQFDATGQTLAGAAKWTGNLGVDYRLPLSAKYEAHTSINVVFNSRYNTDASLSSYAAVGSTTLIDAAVGIGRRDQKFDVSVLVKNATDSDTPLLQTWNTITPQSPRWWYLQFTGKM